MHSKQKQAEYRENQIGIDFTTTPSEEHLRVHITGEILTASNFPNSEIFISYKFALPNGWKSEIPEELLALDLTPIELKEYNCLESITQTVAPTLVPNRSGGVVNEFYFSFPLDIQLLAKQKASSLQWPALHFQVFQKDSWDRIYMQGCGYLTVPSKPGTYVMETLTWKPNLDYRTRVFQFFLGGLTRPKDIEIISKSQDFTQLDNPGPINRSRFNTVSSGSIKTRLNIATQSKAVKIEERTNYKVLKFSQQTELVKQQYSKAKIPGQVNTGNLLGGRFTTTKLNV